MKHCKSMIALAVGAVLTSTSIQAVAAGTASGSITTTTRGGFLTKSDRHAPAFVASKASAMVDRLCAQAARSTHYKCPPSLKGSGGYPTSPDEISAGLHHLRLNIILRDIENVVVQGTGVTSLSAVQDAWARIKITSTTADDYIPAAAAPPTALPVPEPGDPFMGMPAGNALFQGIIVNGCVGTPATFDLALDSEVFRVSSGEVLGDIDVNDEVDGYGYYNFKFKIRATDESGNISDFVFSGDADAFCTGKATL